MACACFIICWMFIPPGNFISLDLARSKFFEIRSEQQS
jgi:hypothetical protein